MAHTFTGNHSGENSYAIRRYENNESNFYKKLENLDKTVAAMIPYSQTQEGNELVIRQGQAIEVANPLNVTIKGNIDAPTRYVTERPTTPQNSICYFDKSQGTLELIINESQPFGRYTVRGEIKVSGKFKTIGINNPEISSDPKTLARKLKMLRRLFVSKDDHMVVCNKLNNFEATVKRVMEESQNDRGDYHSLKNQAVASNIPESFQMVLPIIEGEPPTEITIHTVITADSKGGINCALESVDAAEYIEDVFDTRIDEEIEKLKGLTTLISK